MGNNLIKNLNGILGTIALILVSIGGILLIIRMVMLFL